MIYFYYNIPFTDSRLAVGESENEVRDMVLSSFLMITWSTL